MAKSGPTARTAKSNGNLKPFKPGQSGNPKGRPKGSRDRINEAFLRDVMKAWEQHGVDAINKVAQSDPVNFVKVVAGLLPKDVNVAGEIDHQHHHEHKAVSESAEWITGLLGGGKDRAPSKPVLQ